MEDLHAAVARRLEAGSIGGPLADVAAHVWGALARLRAPLRWREEARILVVGGATLGGSGKTPLALACARELHETGARVAFVGHAFGASPRSARFVSEGDDVRVVGDEALQCQRELAKAAIPVAVAPTRQRALDLALSRADLAIVDGPCQTRPRRATLALLAVDGRRPWGAGRCPPRGDLRAPRGALVSAVDRIVAIAPEDVRELGFDAENTRPLDRAWIVSNGANLERRLIGWCELRRCRVGLWTLLARPDRIVAWLALRGVHPVVTRASSDHGPARLPTRSPAPRIDLWLCTPKCRAHLPADLWGRPIATLDHSLRIEVPLKEALAQLDPRRTVPIS